MLPGHHDVTLDGKRIASIGRTRAASGEVIDLGGMTLMPGLITCHFHPDFYKFKLGAGEPPGKELPPGVMMAIGVRNCRVLLESGFTGYVGASCGHDIDAQLKMAIAQGIIPGPRIRACSRHIGTTGDVNDSKKWWRPTRRPASTSSSTGPTTCARWCANSSPAAPRRSSSSPAPGTASRAETRNMDRDEIAAIVDAAHGRGPRCARIRRQGDDPRMHRARRRHHRPRRRDRRRDHRGDGRSRAPSGCRA